MFVVNLGFYFMFRTNLNERFDDPSLTWSQVLTGAAVLMFVVYHFDRERGLALMMSMLAIDPGGSATARPRRRAAAAAGREGRPAGQAARGAGHAGRAGAGIGAPARADRPRAAGRAGRVARRLEQAEAAQAAVIGKCHHRGGGREMLAVRQDPGPGAAEQADHRPARAGRERGGPAGRRPGTAPPRCPRPRSRPPTRTPGCCQGQERRLRPRAGTCRPPRPGRC